ncbi:MAG TPA: hypothetical protein VGO52_21645 [Hyphomonadaceae bacterium]|jgi:hypothetical protein|nr:hypothetical protein [Hyphomonadaceae bacterium]
MLRFTLLIAALALSATAHAQTAPKGWKIDASANAWLATSPDQKVRLAFYPVVKNASAFVFWFQDEGLRRTSAYGRTVINQDEPESTTNPEAGPLLAQSRMLNIGGAPIAVLTYGWQTGKGKQLVQMILPPAAKDSPAYKAAFEEITAAWKAGVVYAPAG